MSNTTSNQRSNRLSNRRYWPTLILLVLTNLIPIYLVVNGQWSVSQLVLLFWMENVIIGLINIVKMWTCQPGKPSLNKKKRESITFFAIHYGGFTLVHGIFVMVFFFLVDFDNGTIAGEYGLVDTLSSGNFWWTFVALLVSHGFSYYWHFLKGGERNSETVDSLFFKPYGRVVILHMTIILGAWLTAWLQQPIWALLLLVLLKIMVDTGAHLWSHKNKQSGK